MSVACSCHIDAYVLPKVQGTGLDHLSRSLPGLHFSDSMLQLMSFLAVSEERPGTESARKVTDPLTPGLKIIGREGSAITVLLWLNRKFSLRS